MSHFAKVDQGKVIKVIVAEQEFIDNLFETVPGKWIQTSYNTRGGVHYESDGVTPSADQTQALRKNFAFIGGVYDFVRDAFYEPQPYPSWTLNETTCFWEPPVEMPTDGNYTWNETTQSWDAVE